MKKSILIVLGILLLVYGVAKTFLGPSGLIRQFAINDENLKIQMEIDSLKSEALRKKKEIKALEEDPFEIEKKARTQMGMTKKGEVVFKFKKPISKDSSLVTKIDEE